jgi:uncharacterized protein (DUF2336 family)
MSGTGSFSEAQLELFDDVMTRLAEGLEVAARAAFGSRLATTSDAPLRAIRLLAFDEAIEVAGPVPALRAPICFTTRLMGPIMLGLLSLRRARTR